MSAPLHEPLLLSHTLSGPKLATANRVLRWHGVPEVGPCLVGELLACVNGMEIGRAAHIVDELVDALAGNIEGR